MRRSLLAVCMLGTLGLAGCATTPYAAGVEAAKQGRYAEAVTGYEEALNRDPNRLDALIGLGIARYKLGALTEAIEILEKAVARTPAEGTARLYLALGYLRTGDAGRVDEHLTAFIGLQPDRRLAAQADRTLKMLRAGPISEETRAFVAVSLEDEAELVQEASEAWRALDYERYNRWYYPYYPGYFFGPGCYGRAGRLRCF